MGTIAEAAKIYETFLNGFESAVLDVMKDNSRIIEEYITQQLYSGLDGNSMPLRPTYTGDPWFSSADAGRWRGKAEQYMKWKRSITPPARSWLGHPERSADTPNLFISGEFYSSIKATPLTDGMSIGSNIPMGGDIERKYGSAIFKPDNKSVEHFVSHLLKPRLTDYLKKCHIL